MKFISNAFTLFIIAALAVMVFHGRPKQQAARDLSEDHLFCMAQNVYHEARGENALGQAAVAHVTLNRVRSPAYPDSVCGVVWQKGQFSWTEDGRSDQMTDLDAIGKAVDIALAASRGKIKDPTGGALHFYAHNKVRPRWSKAGYRLIVGEHTFISGL
jgi:spore germination cell wall hydrolase CwlJ-like protein